MFLKRGIKNLAKDIFYLSGLTELMLICNRKKLCIMCYHRITSPGNKFIYLGIPQDVFEKHIIFLSRYFKVVPLRDAVDWLKLRRVKETLLALTFDDGYRDNYLYAWPVLKKYNLTGTFFLSVDYIETEKRFWWDTVAKMVLGYTDSGDIYRKISRIEAINRSLQRLQPKYREIEIQRLKDRFGYKDDAIKEREIMDWREIKEMHRSGMDFGSHTLSHSDLAALNQDGVKKEMTRSKSIIEGYLGRKIYGIAYPFGSYNDAVKRIAKQSGYSYARSIMTGFNSFNDDIFALRRIDGLCCRPRDLAARLSYRGILR